MEYVSGRQDSFRVPGFVARRRKGEGARRQPRASRNRRDNAPAGDSRPDRGTTPRGRMRCFGLFRSRTGAVRRDGRPRGRDRARRRSGCRRRTRRRQLPRRGEGRLGSRDERRFRGRLSGTRTRNEAGRSEDHDPDDGGDRIRSHVHGRPDPPERRRQGGHQR